MRLASYFCDPIVAALHVKPLRRDVTSGKNMEFSISVCIPAYCQPILLTRCLDSLVLQDIQPMEVIVTDDSPDDSVAKVVETFISKLPISYFRNPKPLGSPTNWNAALSYAKSELVLLLHHDDYLACPDSLRRYADEFKMHPETDAVSSKIVTSDTTGKQTTVAGQEHLLTEVYQHPHRIVAANLIGPPSLLMLRREILPEYDPAYIWLVDLEFYLRLMESGRKFRFIDRRLVTIALHPGQVTNTLINAPIVLREHMYIAQGRDERFRSDHAIYDHYWRMLRNFRVRNLKVLEQLGIESELVPPFVKRILRWQARVPMALLRFGPFSRLYMEACFRTG
ncbi:MAG: glycosyltransferase family 2 protein [Sphingobacteriales bacterium]|nr:MAG: glycosyltransferase family 2 protein [Sphingobacteriales bacterium]